MPGTKRACEAQLDDTASAVSRQKSCNACVRGKRRCDKSTPRCGRCSDRGLDCVYQKLPLNVSIAPSSLVSFTSADADASAPASAPASAIAAGANPSTASAAAAAAAADASADVSSDAFSSSSSSTSLSCAFDAPGLGTEFDMNSLRTRIDTSSKIPRPDVGVPDECASELRGNSGLDFSMVDFMTPAQLPDPNEDSIWNLHHLAPATTDKLHMPTLTNDLFSAMASASIQQQHHHHQQQQQQQHHHHHQQQQQQQQQQQVRLHPQLQPIRDPSLIKDMDNSCPDFDPTAVYDPNTRVGYTVGFLSTMHKTFAETRSLPFMHSRLWTGQLPKAILAAFSASAVYAARTPPNKGWTIRMLADASRDIHREGEAAVSQRDKLSRVQALLILNSMRIFDGDLGLRAAAERETSVWLTWLKDLKQVRDEMELDTAYRGCGTGGLAALREKPPKSWESWVFLESTRRTILTSYAIICLSCVLKSELPDDDMWYQGNTYTASRHLWGASTSVEFYHAWREKPQFSIADLNFKEFWVYARPDDCDEFTRIMLTGQLGVDVMAHFMNAPGKIA